MRIRPLTIVCAFALLTLAAPAGAAQLPPDGYLTAIAGTTAFVQDEQRRDQLIARDLLTGSTKRHPLPAGYAAWNDQPVAGNGLYAGVIDPQQPGRTGSLFVTGPGGLTTLADWPSSDAPCSLRVRPLWIGRDGSVTALRLGLRPNPGHDCAVDDAATQLVRYRASGAPSTLWLPSRFRRLLPRATVSMYGPSLAISTPAAGHKRGNLVALSLRYQKVLTERRLGAGFSSATLTAPLGLTAIQRNGSLTTARHISTFRPGGRLIFRGRNAGVVSCGRMFTAVTGRGSIRILDLRGRTAYRRSYRGAYDSTAVTCSDRLLNYVIRPANPAGGPPPAPGLPQQHRATIDLFTLGD
jgi:hypothetical protein